MINRMDFILPLLIFVLVTVIVVPPVYAKVLTFDIDKHTFYVAGDTITFSGTSATAFLEKGQPFEEGLKVLFDFSVDGSPVVPSAYVVPIELKSINDLTTNEETKLAFTAALVNSYRGNETLS